MQGRYRNASASAKQQFISPGLLRQQHAKRSYPNHNTDIEINTESYGKKPAAKQHAKRTYASPSIATIDDLEEERFNLLLKKLAAKVNGTGSVTTANDDFEEERFNLLLEKWAAKANGIRDDSMYDSKHDSENNSDHENEYDSAHESQYSVGVSEDENTTANLINKEKYVSINTDRPLDKGRPPKKQKSTNHQVSEITRDDHEEDRDSCRAATEKKHMDVGKKAVGTEEKRGRGKNKCRNLAKLKPGEKIKVTFYNNRALSTSFARHIGRIIRDPTITPVRVKKWTDIAETSLNHIFAAVKDKFENIDENVKIDVYKDDIMEHARDLWNNWRGDLSRHYVKPTKNMQQAIKNCPADFPQADWEWLVKEFFYSKEFMARSKRNTRNRSNLTILHHSGSKPFRKIIYDNGGKDNNPPSLDALFFMTHTKDGSFMDSESSSKHAQLEEQKSADPSQSNAQLMDKCFPSKRQDHIIGYGGGVKARHLRSSAITKAELIEKLKQSEDEKRAMQEENRELREENRVTNSRVSRMEKEWEELKNKLGGN